MKLNAVLRRSDPALRGGEGAPQQARHVLDRFSLHVSKHPGDPLFGGRAPERAIDQRELGANLGAHLPARELGQVGVACIGEAEDSKETLSAEAALHPVDGDLHQPSAERFGVAQAIELGERGGEGVLHDVLGFVAITHETDRGGRDRENVAPEDGLLRPPIVVESTKDEVAVREACVGMGRDDVAAGCLRKGPLCSFDRHVAF
jgi:hypothetical protein